MSKVIGLNQRASSRLPTSSKVQGTDTVEVSSTSAVHGRSYVKTCKFTVKDFAPHTWAWLVPSLIELSQAATFKRMNHQELVNLRLGLKLLDNVDGWNSIVFTDPNDLTFDLVARLFSELEDLVHIQWKHASYTAAQISAQVRKYLTKQFKQGGSDVRLQRIGILYKPKLRAIRSGRPLISDLSHKGRPPLSALPYVDFDQSREEVRKTILADLEVIATACNSVIDRFERAISTLELWRNRSATTSQEEELAKAVSNHAGGYSPLWTKELREILYSYALKQHTRGLAPPIQNKYWRIASTRPFAPQLREVLGWPDSRLTAKNLLCLDYAPTVQVLLACALLIQLHTGWNFSSVLELRRVDLEISEFPHKLQSSKRRSGDRTPFVFVEKGDASIIRAMRILAERADRLTARHKSSDSENILWASSRSIFGGTLAPATGWGNVLRELIELYQLPRFSLEQVRQQVLAAVSVGPRGNDGARLVAGHSELRTTLGYTNKLLTKRYYASNSLEFERRFDNTIRYMLDPDCVPLEVRLIAYPIGDGALCNDPERPPLENLLVQGLCKATSCHDNGGCPNRVIVIDEARIEEVLRTKEFYGKNWSRLADANLERFEKLHLPAMLFNYALYGALARGPYRHLLKI